MNTSVDKVIIGVDPGITGAISILMDTAEPIVFDIPAEKTPMKTKKKGKTRYKKTVDMVALDNFLSPLVYGNCIVFFEEVGAMPNQGVTSMFSFGQTVGRTEAVLKTALGCPIVYIRPKEWKKHHGLLKTEKTDAVILCQDKYPGLADTFRIAKTGRADATLIAEFGRYLLTAGLLQGII